MLHLQRREEDPRVPPQLVAVEDGVDRPCLRWETEHRPIAAILQQKAKIPLQQQQRLPQLPRLTRALEEVVVVAQRNLGLLKQLMTMLAVGGHLLPAIPEVLLHHRACGLEKTVPILQEARHQLIEEVHIHLLATETDHRLHMVVKWNTIDAIRLRGMMKEVDMDHHLLVV